MGKLRNLIDKLYYASTPVKVVVFGGLGLIGVGITIGLIQLGHGVSYGNIQSCVAIHDTKWVAEFSERERVYGVDVSCSDNSACWHWETEYWKKDASAHHITKTIDGKPTSNAPNLIEKDGYFIHPFPSQNTSMADRDTFDRFKRVQTSETVVSVSTWDKTLTVKEPIEFYSKCEEHKKYQYNVSVRTWYGIPLELITQDWY